MSVNFQGEFSKEFFYLKWKEKEGKKPRCQKWIIPLNNLKVNIIVEDEWANKSFQSVRGDHPWRPEGKVTCSPASIFPHI